RHRPRLGARAGAADRDGRGTAATARALGLFGGPGERAFRSPYSELHVAADSVEQRGTGRTTTARRALPALRLVLAMASRGRRRAPVGRWRRPAGPPAGRIATPGVG